MSALLLLILLQDGLTIILICHVIIVLRRIFGPADVSWPILLLPLLLLLWGAAWSYVPSLAATRLAPPPLGQVGVILAALAVAVLFWLSPHVRRRTGAFDAAPLLQMAVWRAVFGMSVLAVGVAGGLPPTFFWSVGLGDLAVGLIGCGLLIAPRTMQRRFFVAWNMIGIADLSHVLILGAITLVPFFVENPDLPFVNLLPLTGVPLLLSLHILGLRFQRGRYAASRPAGSAPDAPDRSGGIDTGRT
jgi:hypothetical protein